MQLCLMFVYLLACLSVGEPGYNPVWWTGLKAPINNNNNNEYLERLTSTGPKRLHVLYKYILSKFNAYNINAHTHPQTHALIN